MKTEELLARDKELEREVWDLGPDLPRPESPSRRLIQFRDGCSQGEVIFRIRNAQYGDAISETGVLGACVELVGTIARLKTMVIRNPRFGGNMTPEVRKSLQNILLDVHNYANIALMMLAEDNFRGDK